jgi:hypothetical protein
MPATSGKPSLENAFARVDWAKRRLGGLKAEIDAAVKVGITIPASATGVFEMPINPVPKAIPTLIGEVVYNLRTALEYLAFQLAYLDTGQVQKGTKFPIEDHLLIGQ